MIELTQGNIKNLIKTLNERGFILEERAHQVIDSAVEDWGLKLNEMFYYNQETAEIDIFGTSKNTVLFCECMRTDYSWFFPIKYGDPSPCVF